MNRVWHKCLPPKLMHKELGIYKGIWMPQMDRYWESEDGYGVMSRQIRTDWGVVDHVTITRMGPSIGMGGALEVPWSVKQEIKDDLFGEKRVAIEVFPAAKNLVDVCDVYHLWVLPKDMTLPFGIHPTRDPQGFPIQRGYDFDAQACKDWCENPARKALEGNVDG